MDKVLYDILNVVNQGMVILDEELRIRLWNDCMERITGIGKGKVMNKIVYEALPSLSKDYYKRSIESVLEQGNKLFLSSSLHRDLISKENELNVKISRFEKESKVLLLLEFIDVTSQVARVNQLRDYVKQLYSLNNSLKEKEKLIKNLAYYDRLTGAANRTLFYEKAEKLMDKAKESGSPLGVVFIDVNKFKSINDTYGHKVGDQVLVETNRILSEAAAKDDLVARFGGDEFLILLSSAESVSDYKNFIFKISNNESRSIMHDGNVINISFSIGVSFYPKDGNTLDELIVKADEEMYIAKNGHAKKGCTEDSLEQRG